MSTSHPAASQCRCHPLPKPISWGPNLPRADQRWGRAGAPEPPARLLPGSRSPDAEATCAVVSDILMDGYAEPDLVDTSWRREVEELGSLPGSTDTEVLVLGPKELR